MRRLGEKSAQSRSPVGIELDNRSSLHRHGTVLVPALVALAVIALLGASVIRLARTAHDQLELDHQRRQAVWLAESGLERAAAQLAANRDYTGEIWSLSPDTMGAAEGGTVRIRVERVEGESNRRLVRVQADYPAESDHRARHSKQTLVEFVPKSSGEKP